MLKYFLKKKVKQTYLNSRSFSDQHFKYRIVKPILWRTELHNIKLAIYLSRNKYTVGEGGGKASFPQLIILKYKELFNMLFQCLSWQETVLQKMHNIVFVEK